MSAYLDGFLEEPGYLNHASVGPVSATALRVQTEGAASLSRMAPGAVASITAAYGRMRELAAAAVGVPAEGVVAQPSTTPGLHQVLFGLEGRLLASSAGFPSLPVSAVRARDALGRLSIGWIDGPLSPEAVSAALTDDVTAVAVDLVDARTGRVSDLAELRDVIGDRLLVVDAMQAFGALDADYAAADVVATGGHKWLRAGWGAGFLSMGERALERIAPVLSGVAGTGPELPWDRVPEPQAGSALAFGVANPDWLAVARLSAALEEIAEETIGRIGSRVLERAGAVRAILEGHGIEVVTPRGREGASGIVVARPRADGLPEHLAAAGVTATARLGTVRLSAHAGTRDETLGMLDEALASWRPAS